MAWNPILNDLRDVLAALYPTEQDARQLAATAGLDRPELIEFSATAINNWTNILTYASNNEQVDAVIQAACAQFPRNSRLTAAAQRWLAQRQQPVGLVTPAADLMDMLRPGTLRPGMLAIDTQALQATFAAFMQTAVVGIPAATFVVPGMSAWTGMSPLAQPLPKMTDLFEMVHDPAEVPAAIYRSGPGRWLAPWEVPYVRGREGTADVQEAIYRALVDAGGALVVQSRAGLGKTREVVELAADFCRRGWTVCVARGGEADRALNRLAEFPEECGDRLLLVFDDLHRRVGVDVEGQATYAERLEALLAYLEAQATPGSLRVLATARSEPFHQRQLGFDPNRAPWNRFGRYELPECTLDGLERALVGLAERAQVALNAEDVGAMVANSDRTLRTLFDNVDIARRDGAPLTRTTGCPARGNRGPCAFAMLAGATRARRRFTRRCTWSARPACPRGCPTSCNWAARWIAPICRPPSRGWWIWACWACARGCWMPTATSSWPTACARPGAACPIWTSGGMASSRPSWG